MINLDRSNGGEEDASTPAAFYVISISGRVIHEQAVGNKTPQCDMSDSNSAFGEDPELVPSLHHAAAGDTVIHLFFPKAASL